MNRDVRVSGRITAANKDFLKKHKVSIGDAIGKYCELMCSEKELVRCNIIDLQQEIASKKREIFLLEMELEEAEDKLKQLNKGEVQSVEEECIKELASILWNRGFAKNNQDQNIFKNIDVLNIMSEMSQKYNIDMQILKDRSVEYVLGNDV